jgi:hypothetical protein
MHGPSTSLPPVAPPVVAPPLADEVLPPAAVPVSREITQPFFSRVVRDIKIGGVCLLCGWVAGQTGLLDRHLQTSISQNAGVVPAAASVGEVATPMGDTPSDNQVDPSDEIGSSARVTSQVVQAGHSDALAQPRDSSADELIEVPVETSMESEQQGASIEDSLIAQSSSAESLPAEIEDSSRSAGPSLPPMIDTPSELPTIASLVALTSPSLPSPSSNAVAKCEDGTCPTTSMESHGTVLAWADTPSDAYRMADAQDKLVFMIHVSGNFEIPGFT